MNGTYEAIIGLEIHAQLLTATKAFCGCPTTFGNEPNTNVCPICLGMPGSLPVLNVNVVEFALRLGLATHCRVAPRSIFARKNYFYPDLPKGYQISQYEEPICTGGYVEVELDNGDRKKIGITRIHMEEDAGKSIHEAGAGTLIDLNRCGVPLLEIVTEPDLRSPREAYHLLGRIRQLVTYLGICDGNMEEGSLRCDANVSVRRVGQKEFGTKTELKNMNSFRNVERALDYEITRQVQLLEDGGEVVQETLSWDADRSVAVPMRGKEEAHDYRYFPDPDLVPVLVDEMWIDRVRRTLPELPTVRRDRFVADFGLPKYDAEVLTTEKGVADYYEEALALLTTERRTTDPGHPKAVSNWVMTDVLRVLGEEHIAIERFPISPKRLASMIGLVQDGTISGKIAKELFDEMLTVAEDPRSIVKRKGMSQISDVSALDAVIDEVLRAHASQVEKYLAGSPKVFGFFVGEAMKMTQGKANPKLVNEILTRKLEALKR